jgi:hypothetical protein
MIEIMNESSGNVIGIRATGMLTTDDYDRVLVPKLAELSDVGAVVRESCRFGDEGRDAYVPGRPA